MHRVCKECFSDRLVEDYSDGSLVCSSCGLIAEKFLLDDRPCFDASRNIHSETYTNEKHIHDLIGDTCFKIELPNFIAEEATERFKALLIEIQRTRQKIHQTHKRALMTIAITTAIRKHNIFRSQDTIAQLLQVETKIIKAISDSISFKEPSNTPSSQAYVVSPNLSRWKLLVNQVFDKSTTKMKILSGMEKLDRLLSTKHEYIHKKPSKMDGALLYYTCQKLHFEKDVSKEDIIKVSKMSECTFKHHLRLITRLSQTHHV